MLPHAESLLGIQGIKLYNSCHGMDIGEVRVVGKSIKKAKPKALLSDTPVLEAADRSDQLKFEPTAKVLAEAAIGTSDPLTIGVYGEWGTGKTSMMRLIEQTIKNEYGENAVAVWFNAWQYENEEHLIIPLLATISKSLAASKNATGSKVHKAVQSLLYAMTVKGKIGLPHIAEAELNFIPEKAVERYQELTRDLVLDSSLYFNAFEKLEGLVEPDDPFQVVVLVDDLDRCFEDKAVRLLEGIKLVLHQRGFSFVLGVNRKIIENYCRKKLNAPDYLHKIVQVEINIPSRNDFELTQYLKSLLDGTDELSDEDKQAAIPVIANSSDHNPRAIVRLVNRLLVTSRISHREGVTDFSPIAMLISLVMADAKYDDLVRFLDVPLRTADSGGESAVRTIGSFIAEQVKTYDADYPMFFSDLKEKAAELNVPALNSSIDCLAENAFICNVLKLSAGQTWLTDITYRTRYKAQREKTAGEKEAPRQDRKTDPNLREILQEIEENMRSISAGTFKMGSDAYDSEKPLHSVTVPAFEISRYPVTQAQYKAVMGENPSHFKGDDHPVESVSWEDAQKFCEELNKITGNRYRLPSEAEWEYACRAGTTFEYYTGDDEQALKRAGWYDGNSDSRTHSVGQKEANEFGLYDMHGNVWEWCEDDWHNTYEGAPDDGSTWIDHPRGNRRVLRGGSWYDNPRHCRSAHRVDDDPAARYSNDGFRLVRMSPSP